MVKEGAYEPEMIKGPEQIKANALEALHQHIQYWDQQRLDVLCQVSFAVFDQYFNLGRHDSEQVKVGSEVMETLMPGMDVQEVLIKSGSRPDSTYPPLSIDDNLASRMEQVKRILWEKATTPGEIKEVDRTWIPHLRNDLFITQMLGWIQKSRRIYEVSAQNSELYNSLDYKSWTWEQIPRPFDFLVIESPSILQFPDGNQVQCHGILVSKLSTVDPSFPEDQIEIMAIISPTYMGLQEKIITLPRKGREPLLQAITAATNAVKQHRTGRVFTPNYSDSIRAKIRPGLAILEKMRGGKGYPGIMTMPAIRIGLNEAIVDLQGSETLNILRKTVAGACLDLMYSKVGGTSSSGQSPATPVTKDPQNFLVPGGKRSTSIDDVFSGANVIREKVGDGESKSRLSRAISEHDRAGHVRRPRGMGHIPWEQVPVDRLVHIGPTRVKGRVRKMLPSDFSVPPTTKKTVH